MKYTDPTGLYEIDDINIYTENDKKRIFSTIESATLQKPEDIINTFNKNHPDNEIDDNLLCTLFDDADKSENLLMDNEILHKDLRYQLNEKAPKTENEARRRTFNLLSAVMSLYHNPLKNHKYVAPDGHMEGVYDKKTGLSDRSTRYMAIFNFFNPNSQKTNHIKADINPYNKWGN